MRQIVALLLAATLLGQSGAAWAESASQQRGLRQVSYGAGSILGTLVYTPLKALLCVIGGTASGLVFVSSGAEATRAVAGASCKGTWVITPDILKGKKPLDFVNEGPCCGYP